MVPYKEEFIDETTGTKEWLRCTHFTHENSHIANGETSIPSNPRSKYHYHSNIELIYIRKGSGIAIIEDSEYPLSEKNLIIIPPNQVHAAFYANYTEYVILIFPPEILYSGDYATFEVKYIKNMIISCKSIKKLNILDIKDVNLDNLIMEIVHENSNKPLFWEMLNRANIIRVIFYLMQYFYQTSKQNQYSPLFENIAPYIAENLADITAKKASEHLGLSYNYFSHIFKKQMHMTFTEYLTELRISEAKKLLLTTKKDITNIAHDIGFSTTSHFIMIFKKHIGVSPKKFRDSHYML